MNYDEEFFGDHNMTVGALMEKLATLPPDMVIIMSSDGEGNTFSPLAAGGVDLGLYVPESTYHGYVHFDHAPEREIPNVVVFWPIN